MNKCNDEELKAHKANMEKGFQANSVRPGDPGYKYDMRVKYEYDANNADENSWDEDDEEVPNAKPAQNQFEEDFEGIDDNDDDYFDDDFS